VSKERIIMRKTHKKLHQMGTILPKTKRNKQMNPGKRNLLKLENEKIMLERTRGGYTRHLPIIPLGKGRKGPSRCFIGKFNYSFELLRETQSQKLQEQFQVVQNLCQDFEQRVHTYHTNWGELPRLQKVG